MTLIRSQSQVNKIFQTGTAPRRRSQPQGGLVTRPSQHKPTQEIEEPILKTCLRAEGKHGWKTQQAALPKNALIQDQVIESKSLQHDKFDFVSMSDISQEKSSKHVTFADPVAVYSEDLQEQRNQSRTPEPVQIVQYMNLTYNTKSMQTNSIQQNSLVNSKVSREQSHDFLHINQGLTSTSNRHKHNRLKPSLLRLDSSISLSPRW